MAPRWTPQMVDRAVALRKDGRTATEVAEALGVTRNAVIGQMHRVRCAAAPNQPKPVKPPARNPVAETKPRAKACAVTPPAAPKARPPAQRGGYFSLSAWTPAPAPKPPRLHDFAVEPGAVSFEALRSGACRWPSGGPEAADLMFCGAPALEGRPYCARHCLRAYVAPHRPALCAQLRAEGAQ
ncbi:GcrA family cell cycle regulator [Methylocella sp.]|uniref:GcrA family cell cycle regulator n=1 Tax=Methylocella sp. TaxID=1978226 RepID=UPI0035B07BED